MKKNRNSKESDVELQKGMKTDGRRWIWRWKKKRNNNPNIRAHTYPTDHSTMKPKTKDTRKTKTKKNRKQRRRRKDGKRDEDRKNPEYIIKLLCVCCVVVFFGANVFLFVSVVRSIPAHSSRFHSAPFSTCGLNMTSRLRCSGLWFRETES